jgi:hypothetical protein
MRGFHHRGTENAEVGIECGNLDGLELGLPDLRVGYQEDENDD